MSTVAEPDAVPASTRNSPVPEQFVKENPSGDFSPETRFNILDNTPKSDSPSGGLFKISFSTWNNPTKLTQILLVTTVVLLVAILLTVVVHVAKTGPTDAPSCHYEPKEKLFVNQSVCLTSSCIHTASEFIKAIDPSTDPCQDFYEFACGGWIRNNPIPKRMPGVGIVFQQAFSKNQVTIRDALEKVNISDGGAESKARIHYDSCLDTNKAREKLGAEPLLRLIKKLGGWHLLPNTTNKSQNWTLQKLFQDTMENTYKLGGFFELLVAQDFQNASKNVITLTLNLPKHRTGEKEVAYLNYMRRICTLLGANKTEVENEVNKIYEFENYLANISDSSDHGYSESYTIRQWEKEAPFLNWTMLLNDVFRLVKRSVSDTERIFVDKPNLFKILTRVINNEPETIRSYIMWQVAASVAPYLSKLFADAEEDMKIALKGIENMEPWRECIKDTLSKIGFAVGAMFVREKFSKETKTEGEVMVKNIQTAFIKNMMNLDWLDSETKLAAKMKVDAMIDLVGYPDFVVHKDQLDKYYEELEVKPDEYFENNFAVAKFELKNMLRELDKPVDRTVWDQSPSTLVAFYYPSKNNFVIPAATFQPPFFDEGNPKSVNYGGIGMVMGHELTHAFDTTGLQYDRFGNQKQWWSNDSIRRFNKRAECIKEQYSKYTIYGLHPDGVKTIGEDIADNGALKAAFHAYVEYSRSAKENLTLPGLDYNHRQLFFISLAHTQCYVRTKEKAANYIKTESHSIEKFRVNGELTNFKEFSEEFQCELGSPMNPIQKCEVW